MGGWILWIIVVSVNAENLIKTGRIRVFRVAQWNRDEQARDESPHAIIITEHELRSWMRFFNEVRLNNNNIYTFITPLAVGEMTCHRNKPEI